MNGANNKPAAALEDYNMDRELDAFLTACAVTLSIIVIAITLVKAIA